MASIDEEKINASIAALIPATGYTHINNIITAGRRQNIAAQILAAYVASGVVDITVDNDEEDEDIKEYMANMAKGSRMLADALIAELDKVT